MGQGKSVGQTTLVLRTLEVRVSREVRRVLKAGCLAFGLDAAFVTEVRDGEHEIVYAENLGSDARGSFACSPEASMIDALGFEPLLVSDTRREGGFPADAPGSCVAQRILLNRELVGAIVFYGREPRPEPFGEEAGALVDVFARSVGTLLERMRVEENLRRSEQRFRRLFMLSAVGLALVRADRSWGMVNEKLASLLGYSASELERMSWESLTHPDDLAKELTLWQATLAGRRTGYSIEKRFICADESTLYAAVTTRCLWASDGQVDSVIVLVQDLTALRRAVDEGKRLEDQLVDVQKLESLGVLAGGVAHDFNNLLTGVIGNAHLAKAELGHEHPVQRQLDAVLRASERATRLTKQLLAYSGKGAFVVRDLDLTACVSGLGPLLETLVPKKVELRFDLAVQLATIQADEAQVQQVVLNLVLNGAEAIEGNGTVKVTTGSVFLDQNSGEEFVYNKGLGVGACVYLEVTDTGCGMSDEERKKAFDPFYSTKFTGRGLGLAAVLGIVRGHNGAIAVESTPGEGSRFRVFFSTHSPSSRHRIQRIQQEEDPSSELILVVDDEELVRNACCVSLRSLGYSVLPASGGREAVDLFTRDPQRVGAVILDMTMPDMDGIETYHCLREIREDVPIILTSGYSEREALARLEGEPADFLPKPYTPRVLGERLKAVMGTS